MRLAAALLCAAIGCGAPGAPVATATPPPITTLVGATPAPSGAIASATAAPHDGRCTVPDQAPEEVVARLFTFVGQRDQRGVADCFARAYLAAHPDAASRWSGAGPVKRFELARLRAPDDAPRVQVTADLATGVDSWKGSATHVLTLRRDPDRWAVVAID